MNQRAHWSSRLTFILAATGSAVGLGNIWKFPYMAGENGGGAFVLLYLACIALVGIPIFIAELYIGQKSQSNIVTAFERTHRKHSPWRWVGVVGLLSSFLILSFYSVVGGWVLDYEYHSLLGHFQQMNDEQIRAHMGGLFSDPLRLLFWHFVFLSLVVGIVLGGIKSGLERWNNILMPGLAAILAGLFVYSLFQPGFSESLAFLFSPDFSKLSGDGVLEAIGHAFFTLSLGMGTIMTYGSYLRKDESLVKTAFMVGAMDTVIALVAGVVIFTAVFTYQAEVGAGPALMFQTLPVLFSKMPGGYFIGIAFFLLVTFAALTSGVSLLEPVITFATEKLKMTRRKVTLISGAAVYVLGILAALSFNVFSDVKVGGLNFFDLFDSLTSKYFLPLGGLFISLFFGWVLGPKAIDNILGEGRSRSFFGRALLWISRIVAPLAVAVMFVYKLQAG